MKKSGCRALAILIAAVIAIELSPKRVGADGGAEERPFRLYATAAGPIGKVAMSFHSKGSLAVNGREVRGEHFLWGGELLQAPANRSVLVSLDSIGRVTLTRGAVVRLATARGGSDGTDGPVLVASLIAGNMRVKLEPQAGAFVQAADSAFAASRGASFRVGINEGEASLDTFAGEVTLEQQTSQRKYLVRPVGLGSNISVRVRATRQIQVQITDENDRPVPDLPVIFLLGGGGQFSGSLTGGTSVTVTTNAQGIASTTFTAGPSAGSNTITARVESTGDSWTGNINVTPQAGFWTTRNSLIVMGAAAAAVGAGIAIGAAGNDDEGLRPVPPPDVRP